MLEYSAVSLSDSVIFIGGRYSGKIVAKFSENGWSRLPDLNQGRYGHGSIQINSKTFIFGGIPDYESISDEFLTIDEYLISGKE